MNIYEYQRPVGKIIDNVDLKNKLIIIYDQKSHQQVARFCIEYSNHLTQICGYEKSEMLIRAQYAISKWLNKEVNYHEARNIAGEFNALARDEKDSVKARYYRTMAQCSAVTHVKYHGLWACDFAITLINRLYPHDLEAVRNERQFQIDCLSQI